MPHNWLTHPTPPAGHPAHGIITPAVLAAMHRALNGVPQGEKYTIVALSNDAALMATALGEILTGANP